MNRLLGVAVTEQLLGKPVVEEIDRNTRDAVNRRRGESKFPPTLVTVHRATSSPFSFYLKQQSKAAEGVGLLFRAASIGPSGTQAELLAAMRRLDSDPSVHAVLLEHPLPRPLDFVEAVSELRPEKDADGVSPRNLGLLLAQRPIQIPAVALAALAIARFYHVPVSGERVTVVGRSETVGLPLAIMLLARGAGGDATVTIAHSRTSDLQKALHGSSVIFSCAGHPGLLTRAVVPKGATVIDIGLSSVSDPGRPSGIRAVGDADGASLEGWAKALTPVPGGVGPVTVAQLMSNALHAWELLSRGK